MARSIRLLAVALGGAALLASCAPEPAPVSIERVYTGKYGAPVAGCRPAGQRVDAQYPASVPDCDLQCPSGTGQSAATTAAPLQCVPEQRGGSNSGLPGGQEGGQDGGQTSARL